MRLTDTIGFPIPKIVFDGALVVFFIFHLLYFRQLYIDRMVYSVEKLFIQLCRTGFSCLGVSFLAFIIAYLSFPSKVVQFFELLGFYAFIYFLLDVLFGYKKLSEQNETYSVRRQWDAFLALLGIAAVGRIELFAFPELAKSGLFLMALILGLSLLFRIKWIVSINMRTKWLSILFLMLLGFLIFGMLQNALNYHLPSFVLQPLVLNTFILICLIFILVYSSISVLALLFNMPLASITERRSEEIKSFQEISRSVINREPVEDTYKLLFRKCFQDTKADAGWLMLEREKQAEPSIFHTDKITKEEVKQYLEKSKLKQLVEKFPTKKHHYIQNLLENQQGEIDTIEEYKALLGYPVSVEGKLQGVVCLLRKIQNGFDEYQIELARGYVEQASLAFENAALLEASLESERAKQELEIARQVQKQLLPLKFPQSDHFEMAALSESALEVGGDYYDFILLDENRLAVIVADVAGSGASAAFYMAHLKGVFQSLAQLNLPVSTFLEFANEALSRCLAKRVFITVTYALFDFGKQLVLYGRAGHTPVLYYESEIDQAYFLEDEGLGLGIIRDSSYSKFVKTYQQRFNPDDVFVLFTDGIVESRNSQTQREYGNERLLNCVKEHADTSAETLKKLILNDYYTYINTKKYPDDHTLIVIKIK